MDVAKFEAIERLLALVPEEEQLKIKQEIALGYADEEIDKYIRSIVDGVEPIILCTIASHALFPDEIPEKELEKLSEGFAKFRPYMISAKGIGPYVVSFYYHAGLMKRPVELKKPAKELGVSYDRLRIYWYDVKNDREDDAVKKMALRMIEVLRK